MSVRDGRRRGRGLKRCSCIKKTNKSLCLSDLTDLNAKKNAIASSMAGVIIVSPTESITKITNSHLIISLFLISEKKNKIEYYWVNLKTGGGQFDNQS